MTYYYSRRRKEPGGFTLVEVLFFAVWIHACASWEKSRRDMKTCSNMPTPKHPHTPSSPLSPCLHISSFAWHHHGTTNCCTIATHPKSAGAVEDVGDMAPCIPSPSLHTGYYRSSPHHGTRESARKPRQADGHFFQCCSGVCCPCCVSKRDENCCHSDLSHDNPRFRHF